MQIIPIKTRIFQENEDLTAFILKYVKNLKENSVLVVTSKIVALSEGRTVKYENKRQKIKLIKKESDFALQTKLVWLTKKDDVFMADAGIDESNGKGKLILLPKDSFVSANKIRSMLCKHYKIKNLGMIISDSGLLPFRNGVIGMARGYAGFEGIKDYKGEKDIFGRKLTYSKINIADSLTTAATICMGEGNERQPMALILKAPVLFMNKINKKELKINPTDDIFYPLIKNLRNSSNEKRR
jgi:F420-0:gamma-glutamyl ligase